MILNNLVKRKVGKLFEEIKEKSKYHIVFTDAKTIDEKGLSFCLKNSILEIIEKLKMILLNFLMDGRATFGINNLTCKIKSRCNGQRSKCSFNFSKRSRDRYMDEISSKYPNYDFHKHKGYGTKAHVEAIKLYGRSEEHRISFRLKALGELDAGIQKSLF